LSLGRRSLMMAWMSDGVANPSKEIKRPGLRDGQT